MELHLFTGERPPHGLDPYLRTNKRKIGLTAPRDGRAEQSRAEQKRGEEMKGGGEGAGGTERNREERRAIMRN